jgi:hypothetical protein
VVSASLFTDFCIDIVMARMIVTAVLPASPPAGWNRCGGLYRYGAVFRGEIPKKLMK